MVPADGGSNDRGGSSRGGSNDRGGFSRGGRGDGGRGGYAPRGDSLVVVVVTSVVAEATLVVAEAALVATSEAVTVEVFVAVAEEEVVGKHYKTSDEICYQRY